MEYQAQEIEKKWQKKWKESHFYAIKNNAQKPKYYALDMFPYPSGAGLHVGHPLGYIASDIYARYKTLQGFHVLHPMGYDSFGLPAEQYAIQTGQHPKITTQANIARYREQLDKIGFCYDWSREIRTSDPSYYRWTQWIFIQLYKHWYNPKSQKAEPIEKLIEIFHQQGLNQDINQRLTGNVEKDILTFSAQEWNGFTEEKQQSILMHFRLAYLSEAYVNWCPKLGTVLANDEVKDGVSERGGYPVERKLMKQWSLRITAYADRLLKDLDGLDWSESIQEAQRNWIGKSEGASVFFPLENHAESIEVFTTRPDTLFGVSYLCLAPEHGLCAQMVSPEQKNAFEEYLAYTQTRSERERMAEVKKVSGVFSGAYAKHPLTGKLIPVWISDYVLVGYGTGAVMAVPGHDSRDYLFAKHFSLPIIPVIQAESAWNFEQAAYEDKKGILINSDFLNGLEVKQAITQMISALEQKGLGKGKVNYKLRDAVFGRQRYWGEPIPMYYKGDTPYPIEESELPLTLPDIESYLPTEDGEPPLARAKDWKYQNTYEYEKTTMPGWAGSSWYFLRYMDPENNQELVSKESLKYWKQVDLYIGGAEHSTGHLLYVRFWTKFLHDIQVIDIQEPAKKLINQGMILGKSSFVYRIKNSNQFVSFGLKNEHDTSAINVDINLVENDVLDTEAFKSWRPEFADATFILEDGKYVCGQEVEKMSKSKHNVQTPDELVEKYGADTLRCYEMFLGPLEQSKPWDVKGINGVYGFLRKLWRLFHPGDHFQVSTQQPDAESLKTLHKTIKKITEDLERYSFNTPVSTFMIAVNELTEQKCNNIHILKDLLILIAPYAPHICAELWEKSHLEGQVLHAQWPVFNAEYLKESSFEYPVSFNGKMRFKINLPLDWSIEQIQQEVLSNEQTIKWLEGKTPKKVIIVPAKIVNMVV